ncbi:MAG TPA: hypothetical protein VGX76_00565 [Pirellulales bacterium]|nr:hypothetical protein [Pirellulales bacterium]
MPRTVERWLVAVVFLGQVLWAHVAWAQEPSVVDLKLLDVNLLDVNLLDRRIAEAVASKPNLAGAWLYVGVDDGGETRGAVPRFTFRRALDQARAAEQRRELDRLIKSWLPHGDFEVDEKSDREFPFTQFLAELQIRIESDPRLGGCAIADGYYAPDPNEADKLNLVLRGRIAKEEHTVVIEGLCGRLMRSDPAWFKTPSGESDEPLTEASLAISPKTSELKVVEPSESHGRAFYADGLNAFRRRQYTEAAGAFRQAVLESPRKLVYYYWWTLADLAAGDEQTAARRMRTAVKRFREADFDRQSTEYRDVVRSLERVQGPLRRTLLELESKALFADSQTRAE